MEQQNNCLFSSDGDCAREKDLNKLVVRGQEVFKNKNLSLKVFIPMLIDPKNITLPGVKELRQDLNSVAGYSCKNCAIRELVWPKGNMNH